MSRTVNLIVFSMMEMCMTGTGRLEECNMIDSHLIIPAFSWKSIQFLVNKQQTICVYLYKMSADLRQLLDARQLPTVNNNNSDKYINNINNN